MGTRVASNKRRRGAESRKQHWVRGTVTALGGGRLDLPDLQIRRGGSSTMCVTTAVHVERANLSMGGHLTTTALHPLFERLVHGVNTKARKPEFCMTLDQRNNPRISLGGKQVSPIRDLNNNLKAIVWMLNYNHAFSWPLKMVDRLQTDMRSNGPRGFFTLGEFRDKVHEKSDLHLVMERDENKGTARSAGPPPPPVPRGRGPQRAATAPPKRVWPRLNLRLSH